MKHSILLQLSICLLIIWFSTLAASECESEPQPCDEASPTICDVNEQWQQICGCEPSCEKEQVCIQACRYGCFCSPGYRRRKSDNKCVLDCNQCFKPFEYYDECGTACPLTCDNPNPGICTEQCVPGCYCIKGMLRNANNDCVLPSQCPKCDITNECPPNERYVKCANPCYTCEHPGPCPTFACTPGCNCIDGYLRNGNGVCIPKCECPQPCGENEQWQQICGCEPSCEKEQVCIQVCRYGCFCSPGYRRRKSDNKCVIFCNQCFKPFEYYTDCGTACPLTCAKPKPGICTLQCVPGCFCSDGLLRNDEQDCVLPEECPKNQTFCGPNEEYKTICTCEPRCPDCQKACAAICKTGCFCIDGYVRRSDGFCVEPCHC